MANVTTNMRFYTLTNNLFILYSWALMLSVLLLSDICTVLFAFLYNIYYVFFCCFVTCNWICCFVKYFNETC